MIQQTVEDLAAKILSLDEEDLAEHLTHYKQIMEDFRKYERSKLRSYRAYMSKQKAIQRSVSA